MRTYTSKEKRLLSRNQYTYKVTDHQLQFTAEFKREFWLRYNAGMKGAEILKEFGYDLGMFDRKQIDNITRAVRKQAETGTFHEGYAPRRCAPSKAGQDEAIEMTEENMTRLWNEVQYLRQEVDAIKRFRPECAVPSEASR